MNEESIIKREKRELYHNRIQRTAKAIFLVRYKCSKCGERERVTGKEIYAWRTRC